MIAFGLLVGYAIRLRIAIAQSYFNVRQHGIEFVHRISLWGSRQVQLIPYSNIKDIVAGNTTGWIATYVSFARLVRPMTAAAVDGAWSRTMTLQFYRGRKMNLHSFR